jgi:hypothetical protein
MLESGEWELSGEQRKYELKSFNFSSLKFFFNSKL